LNPAITYRLAHAAYELHTNLERQLHEALAELELTLPLADVLWQLDPSHGPLSRRQLAARLNCDPSNVTFLVDRLERRHLVTRGRAGADRRVKTLTLTAAGAEVRGHLIATIARSSMFSQLTSVEQRRLADLLDRCVSFS
jgi:DNA-binding MarR family transcriptional regulator